jgi:predicted NBD/HSP70 family sugar kinase
MEATDSRSAILAAIVAAGQATRAGLTGSTGLGLEDVSDTTDALVADGLITRGGDLFTLEAGLVCGIDLGGSNCRILVADLLGNPVQLSHDQTPVSIGAAALADWLAARITALTAPVTGGSRADEPPAGGPPAGGSRAGGSRAGGRLRAVVVGLPGMITADGTKISGALNVPQIEGEEFARQLTLAIPAPVALYNDSDLALLGELRFGAGRGLTDAVMFTIGAGLGAGVVLDGVLLRGRRGLTGEFGFLPAGPSGETVEDLLSAVGLVRQARALRTPVLDAADLFAADAPDVLEPVLSRFDRALVLALTAATVAYDPDAIILGGGLSPAVAKRLELTRQRLAELLPAPPPELRLASLGDLSGTLGALTVAYQNAYRALGMTESDAAGLPPAAALARLF